MHCKAKNRRNTWCISRFFNEAGRKICRQDGCGDLFSASLTTKSDKNLLLLLPYVVLRLAVHGPTYFDTAIKQWNSVNSDIKVIKDQMTGVQVKKVELNNMLKAGVGIGAALGEINTETVRRMVS